MTSTSCAECPRLGPDILHSVHSVLSGKLLRPMKTRPMTSPLKNRSGFGEGQGMLLPARSSISSESVPKPQP